MTFNADSAFGSRIFQVSLVVALAFLAIGAFLVWRLSRASPQEVRRAIHLQQEGDDWRRLEARLRAPHSKADEIAALRDYLQRYPPSAPPTKREAQALAALAKLGAPAR